MARTYEPERGTRIVCPYSQTSKVFGGAIFGNSDGSTRFDMFEELLRMESQRTILNKFEIVVRPSEN
jgi:hypothetical protein